MLVIITVILNLGSFIFNDQHFTFEFILFVFFLFFFLAFRHSFDKSFVLDVIAEKILFMSKFGVVEITHTLYISLVLYWTLPWRQMSVIAFRITSEPIVYSAACSTRHKENKENSEALCNGESLGDRWTVLINNIKSISAP